VFIIIKNQGLALNEVRSKTIKEVALWLTVGQPFKLE